MSLGTDFGSRFSYTRLRYFRPHRPLSLESATSRLTGSEPLPLTAQPPTPTREDRFRTRPLSDVPPESARRNIFGNRTAWSRLIPPTSVALLLGGLYEVELAAWEGLSWPEM